MSQFGSQFSAPENRKGAIPEAQKTKAEVLNLKRKARQSLGFLERSRTYDAFNQFRSQVIELHHVVTPHIQELDDQGKYTELSEITSRNFNRNWQEIGDSDLEFWRSKFDRLNQAIYELGITNIALVKNDKAYGYEFLKGLDHNLKKKEDPGWRNLKQNLLNMRRLLRKDTDIVGLVYGGNRTGKTTLSIQVARIIQKGENDGDLDKSHFIFNDDDFQEAMDNAQKYDARHIDEMSLLFHKRDGMNTEQKDRNKMMKTYAKKNQFFIGCDNNFYNIDGEFRRDKVDFVIHVPKRGRFEFYSKAKLHKFNEGDNGKPETPKPDIEGRFPNLDPDKHETDELWETYKEIEDKKLEVREDNEESKYIDYEGMAEEVIDNIEDYLKQLEGRDPIISDNLIKAKFQDNDISNQDAKTVKELVENQVDLSNYG